MKRILIAACLMSSMVFAADKGGPANNQAWLARQAEMVRNAHMMAVVGIADALELNEADALKLAERLRAFEEKRRPIRESMAESVKSLKSVAEGAAANAAQVDADVQRVLDGRAQMAALDKELFAQLSAGQTPQKKAKLALFMAKFGEQMRQHKGERGRFHRGG